MGAELARRELIGAGELEWLLLTALADGMFALASGTVEEYRAEPGPVEFVLPLRPGAEPDSLLTETTRRIRVLATLPARNGRDRIVAATGAVQPGARLGDGQDEILALADGRRTARDIAFALGRGVYATMLQLSRMQRTGLLVAVSSQAADAAAAQARRPVARNDAPLASALPRRQRDVPGASRRPWAPSLPQELRAPLGLLRTRAARDTSPGETS
jgi:hypothetical protein